MRQLRPTLTSFENGWVVGTDEHGVLLAPVSRSVLGAWVAAVRPRQWVKNLLVLAAPAAAGALGSTSSAMNAVLAVVAFTAAASGVYLVNDAADVDDDRAHPVKCQRPIAAGEISVRSARQVGVLLGCSAMVLAVVVNWPLAIVLAVYVALTTAYSAGLRNVPVVDIVVVAAGFVARGVAGAVAVDAAISGWFISVVSVAAVVIVAGKRVGEMVRVGSAAQRLTLRHYSLRSLTMLIDGGVCLIAAAYLGWAATGGINGDDAQGSGVMMWLSVLPVIVALARYRHVARAGGAATPERLLVTDAVLVAAVVAWCGTFLLGVYW